MYYGVWHTSELALKVANDLLYIYSSAVLYFSSDFAPFAMDVSHFRERFRLIIPSDDHAYSEVYHHVSEYHQHPTTSQSPVLPCSIINDCYMIRPM